jgi:hypothetical protein
MPKSAITSAQDEPGKWTPPHERKNGPWDSYDLEDASRTMERADQIRANEKMVEAVGKHHEKRAAHHRKLAKSMKRHMKRGLVSEKALEKASRADHA